MCAQTRRGPPTVSHAFKGDLVIVLRASLLSFTLSPPLVVCSSPPAWAQLSGALEQLASAAVGLPWQEKQLADAVLAAWAALQGPPSAVCGMVVAMQAAHDGWRPWTVGAAKAWLPLEVMLEDCVEGKRLPPTTTAEALAGEHTRRGGGDRNPV